MLPGIELMGCQNMAIPAETMQHVVRVESSFNPYAIGVVGGRLVRQPENLQEAVATAKMLEERGYNFSLGLAQVNRHNLRKYGLDSYREAFDVCPNLEAGSRILAECYGRAGGDWGKSFSCYYSGNFVTGYRHGYVQKVLASLKAAGAVGRPGVGGLVRRRIGAGRQADRAGAMPTGLSMAPAVASGRPAGPNRRTASSPLPTGTASALAATPVAADDQRRAAVVLQPWSAWVGYAMPGSGARIQASAGAPTQTPVGTSVLGELAGPEGNGIDAAFVF